MKKASLDVIKKRKTKIKAVVKKLKKLFPQARMMLNHKNSWELLVAVILSAQCTDKRVNEVTKTLFKKYKTLEDYVRADIKEFEKDIYQTGFYHSKAKNILATARIIKEEHGGVVPRTMHEMVALKGVGRKTANVVLGVVYGVVEGIAVDTHVRRLTRLLGLTTENTPEKIEQDLMEILPRKEWGSITYLLIEYGRTYCPVRPLHDHATCPLSMIK